MVQDVIQGYRLDYRIGGGGSGEVYKGEFKGASVAVKILHGQIDGTARRRFEYESLFLQRLRHGGIAEFVDAGITNDGRPYLCTRYFEGVPITDYARDRQLDTRDRVRLILECCHILHFAHLRGVVHRDIKPDNLLVNKAGEVKVLDFGVATSEQMPAVETALTEHGQLLGTLPYMSPEQISQSGEAIASPTDTYSLGVVAYELLAGRLPLELAGLPIQAALEAIQQAHIPPVSRQLGRADKQLDAVILKMLHREPTSRYHSMAEVAEDLQRWLDGKLVLAQMPSLQDEFLHLVRRNQLLAGTVAAVFMVTAIAAGVSTWFAWQEAQARQIAEVQLERTRGLSNFLVEMLQSSNPERGGSQALTVKEVMLKAAGDVQNKISDDPRIEATIRCTLGVSLLVLGDQEASELQATRGNELVAAMPATDAWEECRLALGQAQFYRLDRDAARTTLKDLLAQTRKRRYSNEVLTKAELNIAIADNYDGQHRAAFERMKVLMETPYDVLPEHDEYRLYGVHEYGVSLFGINQFEEAAEVLQRSVDLRTEKFSASHPQTLFSLVYLGYVRAEQGRYAQARDILQRVVDARSDAYGPLHRQTLLARRDLLRVMVLQGDLLAAEQQAVVLRDNIETIGVRELHLTLQLQLANLETAREEWASAEGRYLKVLRYLETVEGKPIASLLVGRLDYGAMLAASGRIAEARQQYQAGLTEVAEYLGEEHLYYVKLQAANAALAAAG